MAAAEDGAADPFVGGDYDQMQGVRVRPKAELSGAVHGGRRDEAAAEGGGV
jgi:hypothetical protein